MGRWTSCRGRWPAPRVIRGRPTTARPQPQAWRVGDTGVRTRRRRGRASRSSSVLSAEMTWTSMGPARAITRLMTEPWVRRWSRLRRLAPSTIWVAFSARATSIRATATSEATTSRNSPPSSSSRRRWAWPPVRPPPIDRPLSAVTWTPMSSPWVRWAMRAARRIRCSVPGAPVTATMTRSRSSQVSVIPWRSRYSSRASSTRSATQSRASSRSAPRFPSAEVVAEGGVDLVRGL